MKAILMSIKPKWCELIFSGEKTIEARKIAPKLKTPYKVYAYQTKNRGGAKIINDCLNSVYGGGKVVGEFVCDRVDDYTYDYCDGVDIDDDSLLETCLEWDEINIYANGKKLHGLHITAPKQYDTPKELSEFWTVRCTNKTGDCEKCEVKPACINNITRPPQSWMYVEEIE